MQLRKLNDYELEELYNTYMVNDFPATERKPLAAIRRLVKTGRYDPLAAEEDGRLRGYAMVWTAPEGQGSLLEYLAVLDGQRSGGLGGRVLDCLGKRYTHLFGEAEAPDDPDPAINDLRRRRLGFYQRNGFRVLNYECALFGVHYNCLYRGPEPDDGAVLAMHQAAYDRIFVPERLHCYCQIPLRPGEAIRPAERWLD